ncbi:MAG: hypothetical protein AB1756_08200 [Acidobacteriota bacterium]
MKYASRMKRFAHSALFVLFMVFLSVSTFSDSAVYDFLQKAPLAKWKRNLALQETLPFNAPTNDNRGFARFESNVVLEDGKTYARVLQMHPEWKNGGRIYGDFDGVTIPANARLVAKVGFLKGATASDGVEFQAFMIDPATGMGTKLVIKETKHDGHLDEITVDLTPFAGKTQTIRLAIFAKNTSTQDWAVLSEAKIMAPTLKAASKERTAVVTQFKAFTPVKMKPIILQPVGTPPARHEIEDLGSLTIVEPLNISDHIYRDTKKPNTYYFLPKEINLTRGQTPGSYKINAIWTKDQKIKTTLTLQANMNPSEVATLEEAVKNKYGSNAVLRPIPYDSANIVDLEGWGDWQIENIRTLSFGSLEGEIPINITMTPETLAELKPLLEKEGLTAGMHIKSGTIEREILIKIGLRYFVGRHYSPLEELNFSFDHANSALTLHGVKNFTDFPLKVNSINLRFKFPNKEEIYRGLACDPEVTIPPGASSDVRVKLIPQPVLQAEMTRLGPLPKPKEKEKSAADKILGILEEKVREKAREKAKEEMEKKTGEQIDLEQEKSEENPASIDPVWNNFFKGHLKSYWMDVVPDYDNQEVLNRIWEKIEVCSYIDRMRKINVEALENVFDPSSYETPIEIEKIHVEVKSPYLSPQPKEGLISSVDLGRDKLTDTLMIYLPLSGKTLEFSYKIKAIKKTGESAESPEWTSILDSLDVTIGTSQIASLFQ